MADTPTAGRTTRWSSPRASSPATYSVVIADDDPLVREVLSALIDDYPGLRTAGAVENGALAAELCSALQPELAVVDVMMEVGGAEAVDAIHAVSPGTIVVAFTARGDRRTRQRLLESGAADVFVKGRESVLAEALHGLAASHR